MERKSIAGKVVPVYLSLAEMAMDVLGYTNQQWIRRQYGRGAVLDPDVMVGRWPGWERGRVVGWGTSIGRLDEWGKPRSMSGHPGDGEGAFVAGVTAAWRREPEAFLSVLDCAEFLNLHRKSMRDRIRRGDWPTADVLIGGTYRGPVRTGWSETTALLYRDQDLGVAPEELAEREVS